MSGDVNLFRADCMDVLRAMPDNSVDLIVTDPPYDIGEIHGGGTVNTVKNLNRSQKDLHDAGITDGYDTEGFAEQALRVMKDVNIYLWCNKAQIPWYFDFYVGKHGCRFDIISWHKNNALPTYSNKYLTDTEYCLYFRGGKGRCFPSGYEAAKTYYVMPLNAEDKKRYGHPTVKPLNIIENLVCNSSREGETVLDPFMGSGTTGVACVLHGRKFIGCEISERFFSIAQDRIEQARNGGRRLSFGGQISIEQGG